jgi:hypothetical protein
MGLVGFFGLSQPAGQVLQTLILIILWVSTNRGIEAILAIVLFLSVVFPNNTSSYAGYWGRFIRQFLVRRFLSGDFYFSI